MLVLGVGTGIFYSLCLFAAVLAYPLVYSMLCACFEGEKNQQKIDHLPLFILSLATGLVIFLVIFSIFGRFISNYALCAMLSFMVLAGFSAYFKNRSLKQIFTGAFSVPNLISLVFFILLHGILFYPRKYFSQIDYDASKMGAEKLYNFAYQQAFLHGGGYPPEELWYSGERIAYYILPRTLAGISANWTESLLGDPFLRRPFPGGYLWHVSDTFFIALSSCLLGVCCYLILSMSESKFSKFKQSLIACFLGLFPLLAIPGQSILQILSGEWNLWGLTRIIENTINEYPFWNYVWADNHSHSSAEFVQVSTLFWFILFFVRIEKTYRPLSILLGILCTALLMSHSWSVLIDIGLLSAAALWAFQRARQSHSVRNYIENCGTVLLVALFTALPDLLTRSQPHVLWYFVSPRFASKAFEFMNVNASPLFLLALFILVLLGDFFVAQSKQAQEKKAIARIQIGFCCALLGILAAFVLGYSGVGVALMVMLPLAMMLHKNQQQNVTGAWILFLGLVLLLWMIPEFIAVNFNMGEAYMRYNTLFRFNYDAFYLIPLLLCYASAQAFLSLEKRWFNIFISVCALMFIGASVYVQWKTILLRIVQSEQSDSWDGLAFLKTRHPVDWKIIEFLARHPEKMLLIEACGIDKSGSYSYAGRISAYSGRSALCGWATHMGLYHKVVKNGPFQGAPGYGHLLDRARWSAALYQVGTSTPASSVEDFKKAWQSLKRLGVTHLVFGEWEKQNYPSVTVQALAPLGDVVFQEGEFGVIKLKKDSP